MGSKSSRGAMTTMNHVLEAIFGNRTTAWTLLFLQCYGEGHALRIGKTSGLNGPSAIAQNFLSVSREVVGSAMKASMA